MLPNVPRLLQTAVPPHVRPLTMIILAMSLQSSTLVARMEKSMSAGCNGEAIRTCNRAESEMNVEPKPAKQAKQGWELS